MHAGRNTRHPAVALVLALGLAAATQTHAATYTWPTVAPCTGTLQACIDGTVHGDVVQIATDSPIGESLDLDTAITLRPAAGFKPRFANFLGISGTVAGSGFALVIEGLELTNGAIFINRTGAGTTRVRHNRLRGGGGAASRLSLRALPGPGPYTLDYDISGNEIEIAPGSVDKHAIVVNVQTANVTGDGRVTWNRVVGSGNGLGAAIAVLHRGEIDFDVGILGNSVRGNFARGGIYVAPSPTSFGGGNGTATVASNLTLCANAGSGFPVGIAVPKGNGQTTAYLVNNTVLRCHAGILVADGSTTPGGGVDGLFGSNLVAYNTSGVTMNPEHLATISVSRNLLFANGANQLPADPNQVNADPQLVSIERPRLRAGSPAIDAGDAVSTQLATALASLPQVDLDGLRRYVGTGATAVDIGAYEFGDASLLARKTTTGGNGFQIDHPALNGNTSVRPQLTKNFSPFGFPTANNPGAIGIWYTVNRWAPFLQSLAVMPTGAAFNVFAPGAQGAFGSAYAHTASAANTSGHLTRLSQTYLNGTNSAIVLVTPNWNQPGTGVYNNHHFAVGPACVGGPGAECWTILNMDFANVPIGATYNVYAQDPSPNAFVHGANSNNSSGASTRIEHPLLDGTPCAQVHVTRKLGAAVDAGFDVFYDDSHWRIFHQGGAAIAGSEFFVIVDPAQVEACSDIIFANGFEAS